MENVSLPMVFAGLSREEYEDTYESFVEPIKAVGLAATPQDMGTGVSSATLFVYIP